MKEDAMSTTALPIQLVEEVIEQYRTVSHELHSRSMPVWFEIELTMPQLKTLFTLANHSPASVGQVAEALNVQLPTASHLVERLVQGGFAERAEDPNDRRRTLVRLTGQGETLVARLRQGNRGQMQAWLSQMTAEDLAALSQGLAALALIVQASEPAVVCPSS
jgi:DNA-binding MarR family transcriptional regulator